MDDDSNLPGRVVGRIRRDVPLAALDAVLVIPAYLIPLVFRFHGQVPSENWRHFWELLPADRRDPSVLNYLWRLYGQMWRYASVQEARRVLLAGLTQLRRAWSRSTWSSATSHRPIPLSVVAFGSALAVMAFGAVRFQSRLFGYRRRVAQAELTPRAPDGRRRRRRAGPERRPARIPRRPASRSSR